MKNNMTLKALALVCAVALLAAAGMKLLPFALAEQYNVGDAEITATVRNLEIDWTSGKVNIAYHSGNAILISEKTTGLISEEMRMRWRLDGDTLRIEYDKPGFHLFSLLPHGKELTVTLPRNLTLKEAIISSTSADLVIPALNADSVKLKSTSGNISAAVNARIVKSNQTSGDLELRVIGAAEEITAASTSGSIQAEAEQTGDFKAKTTSGDIHIVLGGAKKAEIKSTSGSVIADIAEMEALDIHCTSGNVIAYLPASPGFTAHISITSGHFEHHLPLAKEGKDYIAGDGSGQVEIHTTSGNVTLNPKEK